MQLWHVATAPVLTVTAGRATNADRNFVEDWNSPLRRGASMAAPCAGPFRLAGAELRPDGSPSPARRTTLAERGSFDGVEVPALAVAANSVEPATSDDLLTSTLNATGSCWPLWRPAPLRPRLVRSNRSSAAPGSSPRSVWTRSAGRCSSSPLIPLHGPCSGPDSCWIGLSRFAAESGTV